MEKRHIEVVGAGPAGLTAAIYLARMGCAATIYEEKEYVGQRFYGDFQGLENWTSDENVLETLERIGIDTKKYPDLICQPYNKITIYDSNIEERIVQSVKPIFYLIQRGNAIGSFDRLLLKIVCIQTQYLNSAQNSGHKILKFIGGPRQVGKTRFSLHFLKNSSESHPAYLNWDDPKVRPLILKGEIPPNQKLIILDEIHKFSHWRNLIKGLYDTHRSSISFLITGSARLDYYKKGGSKKRERYNI